MRIICNGTPRIISLILYVVTKLERTRMVRVFRAAENDHQTQTRNKRSDHFLRSGMRIESEDRGEDDEHEAMRWPEADERHGIHWLECIGNWTFNYMGAILDKGAERARSGQRLTHDHLYAVPSRMTSRTLLSAFSTEFVAKSGKPRQLISALWKVAAPDFIPAGLCEFIALACQISLPLLVRGLLKVLEEKPQEKVVKEGMFWSLGIFGCT